MLVQSAVNTILAQQLDFRSSANNIFACFSSGDAWQQQYLLTLDEIFGPQDGYKYSETAARYLISNADHVGRNLICDPIVFTAPNDPQIQTPGIVIAIAPTNEDWATTMTARPVIVLNRNEMGGVLPGDGLPHTLAAVGNRIAEFLSA